MGAFYWPITGAQGPAGPTGPTGPAGPPGAGGVLMGSAPRLSISSATDFYLPLIFTTGFSVGSPPSYAGGNWSPIPVDGTLANFRLTTCSDQDIDGDFTATIMINGVDTAIVITIPAGSPAGSFSNTVDTLAVSGGDRISLHVLNASGTATQLGNWSIGF
jgi:hypothetical protein